MGCLKEGNSLIVQGDGIERAAQFNVCVLSERKEPYMCLEKMGFENTSDVSFSLSSERANVTE